LKLVGNFRGQPAQRVASRAEAWVETRLAERQPRLVEVASRAEAWVETEDSSRSRLNGLVASRAEAWVETSGQLPGPASPARRLPRGGVG